MSVQQETVPHTVSLVASENSKITNINLYSGRAEITRLFKFEIKAGQNKVTILGLPWSLEKNSLRVEGRGNASIHDISISQTPRPSRKSTSIASTHARNPLKRQQEELNSELANTQQVRAALNNFLGIVSDREFETSQLEGTLDTYFTLARKFGIRVLDIEKELLELGERIVQEENNNRMAPFSPSWQASIDVHGKVDESVRIYLKYAVHNADWSATYDIRVDTQAKQKAVTIIYKAVITQNTGESWDNAPLTLETAKPSFGIQLPNLFPWRIMPVQHIDLMKGRQTVGPRRYYSRSPARRHAGSPARRSRSRSRRRARDSLSARSDRRRSRSPSYALTDEEAEPALVHQTVAVSDKGNVTATFRVPGVINIPSDTGKHTITVSQLNLDADLMWFAIPAVDTRAHIKAKIKNDSEYSFIPGPANIYVDGSFSATTSISAISPQEVFECPLGLDTSIRFIYHPREKKATQSGFYSKTSTQSFTQRISVINKKSAAISNLKVVDRIPISEDEQIEVKLISPQLIPIPSTKASGKLSAPTSSQSTLTSKPATAAPSSTPAWLRPIRLSENVTAQWDGIDDPAAGAGLNATGKNGKFSWLVSIPSQTTMSLALHFEVNYPENLAIQGL